MVGNGVTDRNFDNNALVPFAHGMALISDQIYEVHSCRSEAKLLHQYINHIHIWCMTNIDINAGSDKRMWDQLL